MLAQDRVQVNGIVCRRAAHPVLPGDTLEIGPRGVPPGLPAGLQILSEDEDILVVVKPAGLLTAATPDERERTAFNLLRRYLEQRDSAQALQIVHRLDKHTSGILVFAKNPAARENLKDLFSRHDIRRRYWAIVLGRVADDSGVIRSYLVEEKNFRVHSVRDRKRGKLAITHYRVLGRYRDVTALEVTLETGRKNQIRVHLSEIGHPVAGDRAYGSGGDLFGRLGLHAFHLGFVHPSGMSPWSSRPSRPRNSAPTSPCEKGGGRRAAGPRNP